MAINKILASIFLLLSFKMTVFANDFPNNAIIVNKTNYPFTITNTLNQKVTSLSPHGQASVAIKNVDDEQIFTSCFITAENETINSTYAFAFFTKLTRSGDGWRLEKPANYPAGFPDFGSQIDCDRSHKNVCNINYQEEGLVNNQFRHFVVYITNF